MTLLLPKGAKYFWPDDAVFAAESSPAAITVSGPFGSGSSQIFAANKSASRLISLYEQGFSGIRVDLDERDRLREINLRQCGFTHYEVAAHRNQLADSFAGQLVIPYIWQLIFWPGCLPGAAQERGDCVSHAASGAQRLTIAGDIASLLPDKASGRVEGIPLVSPLGIKNGVTSSEFQYWWRGYNGDGWHCPTAARISLQRGCLLRNNYPGVIDVSDYSGSLAGRYGSRAPSAEIAALAAAYTLHAAVEANTFEEIRDALGNLHGVQTCGGQGFSSSRDQYGYSPRRGGWAHGFKVIGTDDRPETVKIYGEPLILSDNNWGIWNSGPRDIRDSASLVPALQLLVNRVCGVHVDLVALGIVSPDTGNILIPHGSWWTTWSNMRDRDYTVYAGIKGWDRKLPTDWGLAL